MKLSYQVCSLQCLYTLSFWLLSRFLSFIFHLLSAVLSDYHQPQAPSCSLSEFVTLEALSQAIAYSSSSPQEDFPIPGPSLKVLFTLCSSPRPPV